MSGDTGARPRLRDNRASLVRVTVAGRVAPARLDPEFAGLDATPGCVRLPAAGGIVPGIHAGDPLALRAADHLIPAVSAEDVDVEPAVAGPFHLLAAIGDRVRLASGPPLGVVAGKRGGLAPGFIGPHLIGLEAPDARLSELVPEERVVLDAIGRGLAFIDHPSITLLNLSPDAIDVLPMARAGDALEIAVRAVVPSHVCAAGLGSDSWIGALELDDGGTGVVPGILCFGDLVAVEDLDAATTRFHRPGYVAVGVVSHGGSPAPGHGPGLTVVATGPRECLRPRMRDDASLGPWLRHRAEEGL